MIDHLEEAELFFLFLFLLFFVLINNILAGCSVNLLGVSRFRHCPERRENCTFFLKLRNRSV